MNERLVVMLFTSADKNPTDIEGNAWSEFYAFNAATGHKLWTYDPNVFGAKHDGLGPRKRRG